MIKHAIRWGAALVLVGASAAWAGELTTASIAHGNAAAGDQVFHGTCVACHGEHGKGIVPGTPNFTKKGGVLSLPDKVLISRILHGFQSDDSPMAMPPKGGNPALTRQDAQNALAYLRQSFLR